MLKLGKQLNNKKRIIYSLPHAILLGWINARVHFKCNYNFKTTLNLYILQRKSVLGRVHSKRTVLIIKNF